MHDVIASLNVVVVPAPELLVVEPIAVRTSVVVEELVALMLNPEAEVELEVKVEAAAIGEVEAALVAPEPEADVEVVGLLSSRHPRWRHRLVTARPPLHLQMIQLIADPLAIVEMEATVMEMHHSVGKFIEKLIQRSCKKSIMIQGYGDTIMQAQALEQELAKER
nr:uncharacterized protein LOC117865772 [Setaria viridis]